MNLKLALLFAYLLQVYSDGVKAQSVLEEEISSSSVIELAVKWRVDGPFLKDNSFGKYEVVFSPDGNQIGVIHEPDDIFILNASDGAKSRNLNLSNFDTGAYSMSFSSAGDIAVGRLKSVELFGVHSDEAIRFFQCRDCLAVNSVSFSPSAEQIAYQGTSGPYLPNVDSNTRIVDIESTGDVVKIPSSSNRPVVAYSPDGQYLFTPFTLDINDSRSFGFRVWDVKSWRPVYSYMKDSDGSGLGLVGTGATKNSKFAAVYAHGNNIELHDLNEYELIWSVPSVPQLVPSKNELVNTKLDSALIAPNGKFVLSYEAASILDGPFSTHKILGAIVIRDIDNGRILVTYHIPGVTGISISPDSRSFVYATGVAQTHISLVNLKFL